MTYSEGSGNEVLLYAKQQYRVVSWDQLGCGESDQPDDPSLWTVERYVEEVETVRVALGLGQVVLLGHSWGGTLGLEYCLAYPGNVLAFVAVTIAFDQPQLQLGYASKKRDLGPEMMRMIARREIDGTKDHPEYRAAMTILNYRHMCRMEEWPAPVVKSMQTVGQGPRWTMFGPQSDNCTGTLRNYNRNDDLYRLHLPVLMLASEHDYILPELVSASAQLIPGAACVVFRGCGHMPFWEDPTTYHRTLSSFLARLT